MLRQLIHKEVLLHLRGARFVWVAGLFCGFVLPHLLTSAGAAFAPAPTFQQPRLQRRAVDLDLAKQVEALTRQAQSAGLSEAEVQRRRDALREAHEAFGTYRRAFHDYAQRLLREAGAGRLGKDWLRPEEAPTLALPSQGLEETLGAAALDLLVLLLFHAAAFAAAYVLFLRYDVR